MKKRKIAGLLILVLLLGMIGSAQGKDKGKIQISMYLWDKPMMKELPPMVGRTVSG